MGKSSLSVQALKVASRDKFIPSSETIHPEVQSRAPLRVTFTAKSDTAHRFVP